MAVSSFIFGGDTGISYEELQRRRAIADALGATRASPRNVGEGLSAIGEALGYRLENSRLNKAEEAGKADASGLFDSIASGFGGAVPASPVSTSVPSSGAEAMMSATPPEPGGDIRGGILETANALGVNPVDLATTISYETAGTFDPAKAGPTTQWGQHRGLIQFGEPQAEKYGVDWNNPVGSQLGADGAVAKYLRDTGVKPGMGLLDIYSAINAGGVGRYNASDANNGGAPGTVRDKVEQQMAGHRAKARALLGDMGGNGASAAIENQMAPQQVASADPSFMPEPDPRAAIVQAMAQQAPQQPQDPWQGMREPNAPQAAPEPVQRVAQAMPAQAGGVDQRLIQALSNPYMSDGQKQVLGALLKQQLSANQPLSPLDQAELEKTRIETELLRNPRMSPAERARLEFDREKLIADQGALTNVPGGTTVFDPQTRQPVFTAPKEASQPTSVQEYEYARQQGFAGTLQEWEAAKKGNGVTIGPDGTIQIGGPGKPLTEGQSKDTTYAVRAEGALPILDQYADALAGYGDAAKSMVPGVGNAMVSENFQLAQQAGNEFLQAILRKDTGAAITDDEQVLYGRTYLPKPGDGAAVIEQKKQARSRALEALKAGMPPAAIVAQEKALSRGGQSAPATGETLPAPSPQLLDQARKALAQGRDREAVIKRLEEYGYSAEGL